MFILKNPIFGYLALIWHFLFQDLALDPRENLATLTTSHTGRPKASLCGKSLFGHVGAHFMPKLKNGFFGQKEASNQKVRKIKVVGDPQD